jgi:hypothetical protein
LGCLLLLLLLHGNLHNLVVTCCCFTCWGNTIYYCDAEVLDQPLSLV